MTPDSAPSATSDRVEWLLDELAKTDTRAHELAEDLVRALTELYGAALRRVVELLQPTRDADDADTARATPPAPLERLLDDRLIAALLILHGLHPLDTATRVQRALDRIRPYLDAHSGGVDLVGVTDDVVHLRLRGNCEGCPSSAVTARDAIERAIAESAPEVARVEVDGTVPEPADPGFVPLETVRHRPAEHAMACAVPTDPAGDRREGAV